MAMTNPTVQGEERRHVAYAMSAGATAESLAGIGAVVLAILGLAGVLTFVFASITTIVIGAALFLEGLAIAGSYAEETQRGYTRGGTRTEAMVGGGMSAQTLGGAAGVALGILALAGVAPWTLLCVATIVFGAAMLVGGPTHAELVAESPLLPTEQYAPSTSARSVKSSGAAMALAGLASLALGILALLDIGTPHTLVLVALLVAGGANLLGGSALLGRVINTMR